MDENPDYLNSARKMFASYKALGDKALGQVSGEALNFRPDPESNSLALIVKHMHGNMISRWTDFLNSDGEKENRNRDEEFEGETASREEMLRQWEAGWACLFHALDELTDADLGRRVYIRKELHTVLEAINRQLCHYPYHVGQLVFLAKLIQGKSWKSLSIPRGGSAEFNKKKSGV